MRAYSMLIFIVAIFVLYGCTNNATPTSIYDNLDNESDRQFLNNIIYTALEHVKDGVTFQLKNPQTNTTIGIQPYRTYQDSSRRLCRDYHLVAKAIRLDGFACKLPTGSWEIHTLTTTLVLPPNSRKQEQGVEI